MTLFWVFEVGRRGGKVRSVGVFRSRKRLGGRFFLDFLGGRLVGFLILVMRFISDF